MSIDKFREKVNLRIYSSKEVILSVFRYLSIIVSLIAFGTVLIHFGYSQSIWEEVFLIGIIKACLGFFVFNYLVRILYTFEPRKFFYETRFELIFVSILIIDGLIFFITGFALAKNLLIYFGVPNPTGTYVILMQVFLLFIVFFEVAKASTIFNKITISPPALLIYSFILLISVGAILLMMPEMTTDGKGSSLLVAFFTSTSACCVTGLIIVDTATYFTLKGQIIIMLLIKLGGLNIISFASFFASFAAGGVGIRQQTLMKDVMSAASLLDTKGMLRQIITFSLVLEFIGAVAIYSLWTEDVQFQSLAQKIFFSIFHSVSAFNNAGFSLFTNGLFENGVRELYIMHMVIAVLIVFGGLGYFVIKDMFSIERMRERLKTPWKKLRLHSQVAIYTAAILITGGAILFYFLEKNNVISDHRFVPAIITSIFQSITTRTAGFNTVDISALAPPTLILFMFLMFIGGNSGSTAGGIKTSTFAIIVLSAYSTLRGKKNLELGHNTISFELLNRAFFVFLFATSFILTMSFLLSITDPEMHIMQLLFEEVSAFGTVGLSTGITTDLSVAGKYIIIVSMFIGRIGPLSLGFALAMKVLTTKYSYPKAHLMVG